MNLIVRCAKCKDEQSPRFVGSPDLPRWELPLDWREVFSFTLCKYCTNEARELVQKLVAGGKK